MRLVTCSHIVFQEPVVHHGAYVDRSTVALYSPANPRNVNLPPRSASHLKSATNVSGVIFVISLSCSATLARYGGDSKRENNCLTVCHGGTRLE